jgi:hypothetical protein
MTMLGVRHGNGNKVRYWAKKERFVKSIGVSLAILFLLLACSHQEKKSDAQISSKDASQMLDDALASNTGDGSAAMMIANQLVHDTSNPARVFVSYANSDPRSPMGPISSVFSVQSLDFLDQNLGVNYGSIGQVRIFFIDSPGPGERDEALIIGVIPAGQTTVANTSAAQTAAGATNPTTGQFRYYAFHGQGQVSHGVFTATLTGDNKQTIKLSSTDVKGDQFNAVIGLSVDSSASAYIGKFSTLKDIAALSAQ